ncbi:unnamed protein product [Soboliphyme baturini]|uniref:Transmembrane protein n=1 Tax=Soboliphyme baturini TaxID=241478 RepID=A0A183IDG2_9BILA|nr:unnamed protein product [Soboliphyme baturini]
MTMFVVRLKERIKCHDVKPMYDKARTYLLAAHHAHSILYSAVIIGFHTASTQYCYFQEPTVVASWTTGGRLPGYGYI